MTEQTIISARSDAMAWQAAAANRPAETVSPAEFDQLRLDRLAETCPAARVAGAILGISGVAPVATDPDNPTEAVSAPLTTVGEVWGHYRHRNADGAGIQLGANAGGKSVVAVHGAPAAWSTFMVEHAVVERRDFDGRVAENRIYRDCGRPVSVSWQPPVNPTRSTGAIFGSASLEAAARRPVRPGQSTPAWLLWIVPPDEGGRTLSFRPRKIGAGLELLTDGVVPLYAVRGDGWTITADAPMAEPLPPWLFAELGGRYGKRRVA